VRAASLWVAASLLYLQAECRSLKRPASDQQPLTKTVANRIRSGKHPEDGGDLIVKDETPEGAAWPEFEEEPQLSAAGGIDPDLLKHYARIL
jgi:hypothetical protein